MVNYITVFGNIFLRGLSPACSAATLGHAQEPFKLFKDSNDAHGD